MGKVSMFSVQSKADLSRFLSLGVPGNKLRFFGNLKIDRVLIAKQEIKLSPKMGILKKIKYERKDYLWIVAGSTHKGEEEILMDALVDLQRCGIKACLILAPRHIERVITLKALLKRRRVHYVPYSQLAENDMNLNVVLVDEMGVLFGLYELADIAFVGGSLVPKGGHNILEPLVQGHPVMFGPYMENIKEISSLVLQEGLGWMITSEKELKKMLAFCATNKDVLASISKRCLEFVNTHNSALNESLTMINEYFKQYRFVSI